MWCSRRLLALHPPLRIPHPEFKSVPGSASGSPSHAEPWRPGVIKLLSKTSRFSRTGRNFVSKFQLDSLEVYSKSASFILGPGGAKLSKRNFLLRCHSKVDFFSTHCCRDKEFESRFCSPRCLGEHHSDWDLALAITLKSPSSSTLFPTHLVQRDMFQRLHFLLSFLKDATFLLLIKRKFTS